jgi:hypothetical protein
MWPDMEHAPIHRRHRLSIAEAVSQACSPSIASDFQVSEVERYLPGSSAPNGRGKNDVDVGGMTGIIPANRRPDPPSRAYGPADARLREPSATSRSFLTLPTWID